MEADQKRRALHATVWAVIVFWMAFWLIGFVNNSTGNHKWFDTQQDLKRMSFAVKMRDTWSSPIDVERVNAILALPDVTEDTQRGIEWADEDFWLEVVREDADHGRFQRLFGSPAKFLVSEDLPDGFGFYLEGEDGISASGGNDEDDINSWDVDSRMHYERRDAAIDLRWKMM